METPLACFPIVSTDNPDEAQAILSREMSALRFRRVQNPRRFRLIMHGVHLGRTMVGYNRFGAETEVDAGVVDQALIFTLCVGPATIPSIDGVPVRPDYGTIASPGRRLQVHREPDSAILILRTQIATLEERMCEVLGPRSRKPLVFAPSIDLRHGLGVKMQRLVLDAAELCSRDGSVLEYPLLRRGLDDMLLNALLSLPSNYTDELQRGRQPSLPPGVVRRAEEYLEAHVADPITIADVVAACGCSRRALFSAFRRYRGYTPRQFLEGLRFKLARARLQTAAPGDTVAAVAYAAGFTHLGRFSRLYRERFGELPSQTIAASRMVPHQP